MIQKIGKALILLWVAMCGGLNNLDGQVKTDKTPVVYHDKLEFKEDGTAYYKGSLYTGESWEYFTSPRQLHEKFTWLNGKKHGTYTEYNEDGTVIATDNWKNGVKHGPFDYKYGLGQKKSNGTFYEGTLDGEVFGYYVNGAPKYYSQYNRGIRNGKTVTYFSDGDVEQISFFKNDKPDGTIYSYYHDSLIRSEIQYKNGIKDGYSYRYHLSGCPAEESYYKNGELDSVLRVYEDINCRLINQSGLKNGKKDGVFLTFDFLGDTLLACNYVDGELDGMYISWESRQIETMGKYVLGQKEGYWYHNMSTGKQLRHGRYEGNMMVGKWYFYDLDGYLLFTNTYGADEEVIKQKFYKRKKKCIFVYPHKNEQQ